MKSLKEKAKQYETPKTLNISDLEFVGVDAEIKTKNVVMDNGESFEYDYIVENNIEYRVPKSVLRQLKVLLTAEPNLTAFRVVKSGTGMQTEYMVLKVK